MLQQLFIEVLLVIGDRQIQTFYGPFWHSDDREEFKRRLAKADMFFHREMGEVHNPAHVKYISCDMLPDGKWESAPVGETGGFYFFKREDAGDWRPHGCHEE